MKKLFLLAAFISLPANYQVFSIEGSSNPINEVEKNTQSKSKKIKSSTMTQQQVALVIAKAGFPKEVVPLVTCLAQYESRFNHNAVNENKNQTRDYGLLQINSVWLKKEGCNKSVNELLDPTENAKCAYKIYKTQGLSAWTTFRTFKEECQVYQVDGYNSVIADSKVHSISSEG